MKGFETIPARLRRTAVLTAFFAFPLFLALFGSRLLFIDLESKLRTESENLLEEVISKVESGKDPTEHFSRLFNRVERKIFSAKDPLPILREVTVYLKNRFKNGIEFVFVDGNGNPVPGFADRPVPKLIIKKFFESYKSFLAERKPLSSIAQSFLKTFMGKFIPIDRQSHGILLLSSGRPDEQYVYFSRHYSTGMLIVFIRPKMPLPELVIEDQLERINRGNTRFRLSIARRGEPAGGVIRRLGLSGLVREPFWKKLQGSPDGKLWIGDQFLARRILFPSIWIIGNTSFLSSPNLRILKLSGSFPFIFAFFSFVVAVFGYFVPVEKLIQSVRKKLLLAFMYSALVPLIVMGVTARGFLAERKIVLENETHRKVEKSIIAFDSLFQNYWESIRVSMSQFYVAPDYVASDAFKDFTARFEDYRRKYLFDFCRVFDPAGKQVFEYIEPGLPMVISGMVKMWPKFTRGIFSRDTDPQEGRGSPADNRKPSNPGMSAEFGGADFFLDMFTFHEYLIGNIQMFFASLPLGNSENRLTHMAYFFWQRKKMEWNYLQKKLFSLSRKLGNGEFFAWAPDSPDIIFPRNSKYNRLIQSCQDKVVSRTRSFRKIMNYADQDILVTGLRGTSMKSFSFLRIAPDIEIRQEIDDLEWKFSFVSLAIIGMCITLGFLLSRHFLVPMGKLTDGMDAIFKRQFGFRIPVTSHDELGKLSTLLNDTLLDLKDLEVAKNLQEGFFPQKPLVFGCWDIFGSCLPATQVGGDYFDYLSLDNDRGLIIMGDVSGHGVGAALVVAMTKAIIGHPSTFGKPSEMLLSLNQILISILKKKKMMTCCLAIVDRKDMTLSMANAGQTYPILLRDGKPSFLELRGYPLGSTNKWKTNGLVVDLREGDSLIFYTDGMIEAVDRNGIQVGYARFLAILPSLLRERAVETERALRDWHRAITRDGPPDDDISTVVVQVKNPLSNSR